MTTMTPLTTSTEVVSVENLKVRYGDTLAVDGVSLTINRGEIFGILGPNGAGKTTTVECIGGLRKPTAGQINVLGLDPRTHGKELHERVGIQLQTSELPDKLYVREALELFASFYPNPIEPAELLHQLGLEDKADTRYVNLSGGQRQRLSIALALVGRPELAILDELTTGLDPQSRRETWKLIEGIRDQGLTVILVTHFMEEAEYLCDRVALLHHGRIRAIDTPANLGAGLGQRISFRATTALESRPNARAARGARGPRAGWTDRDRGRWRRGRGRDRAARAGAGRARADAGRAVDARRRVRRADE